VAFEPKFENLLKASQEATEAGIRLAGIDARLCEIGETVQETIESFEVEIDGKVYPCKSVHNLCGHSIEQYRVHGGKFVPNARGSDPNVKMEEVGRTHPRASSTPSKPSPRQAKEPSSKTTSAATT